MVSPTHLCWRYHNIPLRQWNILLTLEVPRYLTKLCWLSESCLMNIKQFKIIKNLCYFVASIVPADRLVLGHLQTQWWPVWVLYMGSALQCLKMIEFGSSTPVFGPIVEMLLLYMICLGCACVVQWIFTVTQLGLRGTPFFQIFY